MYGQAGEPTYIFTSGNHHWNHVYLTVQDRPNLVFGVKACSEVRLMLGEQFVSNDVTKHVTFYIKRVWWRHARIASYRELIRTSRSKLYWVVTTTWSQHWNITDQVPRRKSSARTRRTSFTATNTGAVKTTIEISHLDFTKYFSVISGSFGSSGLPTTLR